jgi:hypothetical protein
MGLIKNSKMMKALKWIKLLFARKCTTLRPIKVHPIVFSHFTEIYGGKKVPVYWCKKCFTHVFNYNGPIPKTGKTLNNLG